MALFMAFVVSGASALTVRQDILGGAFISFDSEIAVTRYFIFTGFSLMVMFMFYDRGHYTKLLPYWDVVRDLVVILAVVALVDGFLQYSLKHPFSRMWLVLSWLVAVLFVITFRELSRILSLKFGIWQVKVGIIASGDIGIGIIHALMSERRQGYEIHSVLWAGEDIKPLKSLLQDKHKNIKIGEFPSGFGDAVKQGGSRYIVIALDNPEKHAESDLVRMIDDAGCTYGVAPPLGGFSIYGMGIHHFFGHDVILLEPSLNLERPLPRFIKRVFDLVFALFLFAVLSPLFVLFYIFIRQDGGRALFNHTRVGFHGKHFECKKFRTMKVDADKELEALFKDNPELEKEWKKNFKLRDDPRITRIGRFLRKSSLDELPQLINVLTGEMSLVGPRPIVDEEQERYGSNLELYLSVRPGITGLWQISGRTDLDYSHRVFLDAWYIRNWSLWQDFAILCKTVPEVLRRTGAY